MDLELQKNEHIIGVWAEASDYVIVIIQMGNQGIRKVSMSTISLSAPERALVDINRLSSNKLIDVIRKAVS